MSNKQRIKEKMFDKEFNKDINYNNILSKIEGENNMKKALTLVATIVIVCVASISTYAMLGGTINGKPVTEVLGINFSDEYENYVVEENQKIEYGDTSLKLVSKMCDDGYVVLEFDLTLSEKDTEVFTKELEPIKIPVITQTKEGTFITTMMTEKEREEKFGSSDIKMLEGLYVSFNNSIDDREGNNYKLIIDNKEYSITESTQRIDKISDSKYKIYQMYFLTDKELGTKTEFAISLRDIIVGRFQTKDYVTIGGKFDIELSKNKAIENSKVIIPKNDKVTYKRKSTTIEKVTVTPLQTIVKTSSVIDDVSSLSLESTRHKDYIGLSDYKVYDQNGNKLEAFTFETKRTVIYQNGKSEEWATGDIKGNRTFEHAQMKLVEYIIIEKKDETKTLTIKPIITEPEIGDKEERKIELDNFNINLN